jgi:hypothetical protein
MPRRRCSEIVSPDIDPDRWVRGYRAGNSEAGLLSQSISLTITLFFALEWQDDAIRILD